MYSREDRIRHALAPHAYDGSEAHTALEDLADAVREANGDPIRIRSALLDTKTRIRALTVDRVAIDLVVDVLSGMGRSE